MRMTKAGGSVEGDCRIPPGVGIRIFGNDLGLAWLRDCGIFSRGFDIKVAVQFNTRGAGGKSEEGCLIARKGYRRSMFVPKRALMILSKKRARDVFGNHRVDDLLLEIARSMGLEPPRLHTTALGLALEEFCEGMMKRSQELSRLMNEARLPVRASGAMQTTSGLLDSRGVEVDSLGRLNEVGLDSREYEEGVER